MKRPIFVLAGKNSELPASLLDWPGLAVIMAPKPAEKTS